MLGERLGTAQGGDRFEQLELGLLARLDVAHCRPQTQQSAVVAADRLPVAGHPLHAAAPIDQPQFKFGGHPAGKRLANLVATISAIALVDDEIDEIACQHHVDGLPGVALDRLIDPVQPPVQVNPAVQAMARLGRHPEMPVSRPFGRHPPPDPCPWCSSGAQADLQGRQALAEPEHVAATRQPDNCQGAGTQRHNGRVEAFRPGGQCRPGRQQERRQRQDTPRRARREDVSNESGDQTVTFTGFS